MMCHDLLQGVRRVVAVTSAEAEAAVARAEALTKAMEAAQKLTGPALEAEIAALRQVWLCTSSGSLYTPLHETMHLRAHLCVQFQPFKNGDFHICSLPLSFFSRCG